MSLNKWVFSLISLILVSVGTSFAFMLWKDRTYYHSRPYAPDKDREAETLVVYYSRSGHTESAVREIARRFKADIVRLEAEIYSLDFKGWRNAARDADNHNLCEIDPKWVDMSNYKLVVLASPIWLFRPAPPLWTFVENNDFQDNLVVLFNTFNSRFKQEYITEFENKLLDRGASDFDHIFVKRGRIIHQKSGERVVDEVWEKLNEKEQKWRDMAGME